MIVGSWCQNRAGPVRWRDSTWDGTVHGAGPRSYQNEAAAGTSRLCQSNLFGLLHLLIHKQLCLILETLLV